MLRSLDVRALAECEPQRICIVKPSALGDVVQSLPVLEALRLRWPEAALCWVIREDLAALLDGHPFLDEWLPFERHSGLGAFARLLKQLRERRFDLTIDLQGLARSALMTASTAAPIRVGLQNSRDLAFLTHNLVLPQTGPAVPANARYWRLAEVIGAEGLTPQARIPVSPLARMSVEQILTPLDGPLLAVHPGATWSSKRWPVGRFAAVTVRAIRELGCSIVVIGGPDERALSARFVADLRAAAPEANICEMTGQTTIAELAAVLDRVDLLLTNDSGPMHLAASLGTPVVGLFTSTDSLRSGPALSESPQAPRHELVTTPSACRGCYRKCCPLVGNRRNACQGDLSVDHVWQALLDCCQRNGLLAGSRQTSQWEIEITAGVCSSPDRGASG